MFSEDKYFTEFKSLRNKFRKFNSYELIDRALKYINAPYNDEIEPYQRHPWLVLLFIKWVLLDWKYPNENGERCNDEDVYSLLQLSYKLVDKLRLPNEYEHDTLYFRNLAFQQFIYQKNFSYSHLSRQAILFSSLPKNHFINQNFKKRTGLEVQEYLDLSLTTIIRFWDTNETYLPENWFLTISKNYSKETINRFISLISINIDDIRNLVTKKDNGKRLASEHYELTPFVDYPLLIIHKKRQLTHKSILFRHFEHYIYDTMKKINADKFMQKFGELFERYIEQSIVYAEVKFFAEKDIKKALGNTGNQIDFIIQERDSNIFIDTKAVEMNSQGKSTHLAKILRDKTKNSILKAIKQSHDVMRKIEETNSPYISGRRQNYLLVITFKELYLGNGTNYNEVIAKKKMGELYKTYEKYPCIPPENIFFLTIEDFDILSDILKKKIFTLSEILEKAKENDTKLDTRKFEFRMHLNSLGVERKIPEFLIQEKNKILKRISNAYSDEQ